MVPYEPFLYITQDAEMSEIKVQVCLYAFDLLYLNGKVSIKTDWCWLVPPSPHTHTYWASGIIFTQSRQ